MVMSIYTLTDAIVIGKGVGADALAALSITTPLLCILMFSGILFGIGGSSLWVVMPVVEVIVLIVSLVFVKLSKVSH